MEYGVNLIVDATTALYFAIAGCLVGAMIGCVVAVLTKAFPVSMQEEWRKDAYEYLELPYIAKLDSNENIRRFEWKRFSLIAVLCSITGGVLFFKFGLTINSVAYGIVCWGLIAVATIDLETMYIPDDIVLPLLWFGLVFFAFSSPYQLSSHVFGAAAGYCVLRLFPIGRGDAKLCAVAGVWLGLDSLLTYLIISTSVGIAVGFGYYFVRGKSEPCPYGPSLVVAFIAIMLLKF
ncbi:prepilin peptidase [Pseudomonas helleri]|uniref:prepilin peptidase n=1 Tax=Pseudomonas helleri TaxID=1608996 RepID=UPI003FD231E6